MTIKKVTTRVEVTVEEQRAAGRKRRPISLRTDVGEAAIQPPDDIHALYDSIIKTKRPGAPGSKQKELYNTVMGLMQAAYEQGWNDAKK
jgi:hypothetical protein